MIDYTELDSAIGINWYEVDPNLDLLVDRHISADDRDWARAKLSEMGALCGGPIAARAEQTDQNPPRLVRYDRWGDEVGTVVHNDGALDTKRDLHSHYLSMSFSEAARGRKEPVPSTLASAFSYLLSQAETGMLCAVGMTGGAAALVESYGGPEAREFLLPHMKSESFDDFWDGAMFMTERAGGSDVGATETTATHIDGERWALNGFKWFCSNVDADVIATLARPEGAPEGARGLALFALPKIRRDGTPNGLHIHRLKEKLGTRAVPTGEVELVDAEAYLLAGREGAPAPEAATGAATDGRGLVRMMSMVNGSRHGVAAMGLGIARRSFLEAAIYASKRKAWGSRIDSFPLVRETLVRMLMEIEGCAAMLFEGSAALERDDRGIWRILVPLTKYRAARRGLQLASAGVEVLGGNGYIEDWPTARQLRDAQCHTIWEGTENIICLDVRRASAAEGAHKVLLDRLEEAVSDSRHRVLDEPRATLERAIADARQVAEIVLSAPKDIAQLHTRRYARCLADVAQGSLLYEEAAWELTNRGSARKAALVRLFCRTRLEARRLYGIDSSDRTVIDLFDPITRYGEVGEDDVLKASA